MEYKRPTFREKLSYRFDNFMAGGARSIFMALVLVFVSGFVVTAAVRLTITTTAPAAEFKDSKKTTVGTDLWSNFIQIIDPGGIAEDNDSPWFIKIMGILTVFFGLIFFSAVIAFITTQLDLKLEDLKKGRSRVLEEDHTLILGWGDRVMEIIRELVIANESESYASVVIMSEEPKEEMDDYLNEHLTERKTTRIRTRTGVPTSLDALERVAVTEAKSVIVLPTCNEAASLEEKTISDAKTLKTLLAVVAASRDDDTKANIVTEVFNKDNRELMVGLAPDNITMVDTEDMVAKIIVQTSRSSGLAAVYGNLIGFDGCEFYYYNDKAWAGTSFGDLPFHFPDGVPFGIRNEKDGLRLNPDPDYVMQAEDDIIIVAEDDSTINYKGKMQYQPGNFEPAEGARLEQSIEKELIIGWNSKGKIIIEQYTDYILENSVIDVVLPPGDEEFVGEIEAIKADKSNHRINIHHADPLSRADLEALNPDSYNNVILLNKVEDDVEKVDSTTITILLLLRDIFQKTRQKRGEQVKTQIISEVMDSENLELISRTGVNDFIISNQMISKIFSQVSENPDVLEVYEDLFREDGSEIYLKPVKLYFKTVPTEAITFADLMLQAQKRKEVCLGYRKGSNSSNVQENFGVHLNPPKDTVFQAEAGDMLIVVAEDEL